MHSTFINFKNFTLKSFLNFKLLSVILLSNPLHFDFSLQVVILQTLHFDFDSNMVFKGHDSHKYVLGYFWVLSLKYYYKLVLFTKFTSKHMVIDFCKYLVVHTDFVSVLHLYANGQAKSANKVFLEGLKKKLDDAKGLWTELFHEILWTYHTTPTSLPKKMCLPWYMEGTSRCLWILELPNGDNPSLIKKRKRPY